MDDNDLVALALRQEDTRAFGLLVARHQGHLRALLRFWLGNSRLHEADDLAQEAFLQAGRKLATFQMRSPFVTWLRQIAYREFLQYLRRTKVNVSLDDPEMPPLPERLAELESAGFRHDVELALAKLTVNERTAVVCCCLQGWTQEEAAAVLDLPVGTVKSLTHRGRQKLREHLAEWKTKDTL